MNNELISVIIPAYNSEKTIIQTIDSVLQQSYTNFELIVINDGSSDRTLERLQTIKDSRIKIFSYPNGGVSTARNRGIEKATGRYISFLDADDRWTNDKLELQWTTLQKHPQAALAYSWVYFEYESQLSYAETSSYFTGNVYPELLIKNFLHTGSNPLIKKDIINQIGLFAPELKTCEDWEFFLRIAAQKEFILVPKVQIIYRQSTTSLTSNIQQIAHYHKIVIKRAFQTAPEQLQYLKKQSLGWSYKYLAQQYIKHESDRIKGIEAAVNNLIKAIFSYPPNIFENYTQALTRRLIKQSLKYLLVKTKRINTKLTTN